MPDATETNNEQERFTFKLKKIDILEKYVSLYQDDDKGDDDFDFGISLQIAPDANLNQSVHILKVDVTTKKDKENIIASFTLGAIFEIPELEKISTYEGDVVRLPQTLQTLLTTVVIGTMRGVMYTEFRGTSLRDVLLPVLDPSAFQKK